MSGLAVVASSCYAVNTFDLILIEAKEISAVDPRDQVTRSKRELKLLLLCVVYNAPLYA